MNGAPRCVLDPRSDCPEQRRALGAWLAFQQVFAWAPSEGLQALADFGDPDRALGALRLARPAARAVDAARARIAACGALALPLGADAYPQALAELSDAPPLLLVRGDLAALGAPGVAIVGSRAASVYGLTIARGLATRFSRAESTPPRTRRRSMPAAARSPCRPAVPSASTPPLTAASPSASCAGAARS